MSQVVYWTGDLVTSRLKDLELDQVATVYFQDYLAGKCTLTQRKLSPSQYQYIASYKN
jgi:hypothetical protein